MKPDSCILCGSARPRFFHEDKNRPYYRCQNCRLIFVPAAYRLSPEEEMKRYELHENDPQDDGYRAFLRRLLNPMDKLLSPNSEGLDFGSGPGPTLHLMFEEKGHRMNIYDPFYADHTEVLEKTYDFVTATEVVEHLHQPGPVLERLWKKLRPDGYLGIMTKLAENREAFARWHYIRDDTHVAFFSRETFRWLADKWDASISFVNSDVIILHKRLA